VRTGYKYAICFLNKQVIRENVYPVLNIGWKIHLVELMGKYTASVLYGYCTAHLPVKQLTRL